MFLFTEKIDHRYGSCVTVSGGSQHGGWSNIQCPTKLGGICEKLSSTVTPPPPTVDTGGNCAPGWKAMPGSFYCYQVLNLFQFFIFFLALEHSFYILDFFSESKNICKLQAFWWNWIYRKNLKIGYLSNKTLPYLTEMADMIEVFMFLGIKINNIFNILFSCFNSGD